MRFFLVTVLLTLTACTSMLVGNSSTQEGSISADSRTAYQVNQDKSLEAAIRSRFARDSGIGKFDIDVESYDYVVTLRGAVDSFEVRDRAIAIARNTDLVRSVRNYITVNTNL